MMENIANLSRKDKLKFELQILESSLQAVMKIDAYIVKLMMQIANFAFPVSNRK